MGHKRDLTDDLMHWVGMTVTIRETAEAIERQARSYARIQERWASEEMSEDTRVRLEKRETTIEDRITNLVQTLPLPTLDDGSQGVWGVRFEGDPRAWTVRLLVMRQASDDYRNPIAELGADR